MDTLGHGTWLDTNITMNRIMMMMMMMNNDDNDAITIILELQTKQNKR